MNKITKWLWRKLFVILAVVFLLSLLPVVMLAYIDPPIWMWKLQRQLSPPADYPNNTQHIWVDGDKISPHMKLAVIAAEDQLFLTHWGFDLNSIIQAIENNMENGRIRGANTLSQQTAKNLFLWPEKSFLRKGMEAYFTALIEFVWSKRRILEVYLNIVEFGPGIFGVEAASRRYFAKSSVGLSAAEAAILAAVLPNPYRLQADNPSPYVQERSRWIRQQMRRLGKATLPAID